MHTGHYVRVHPEVLPDPEVVAVSASMCTELGIENLGFLVRSLLSFRFGWFLPTRTESAVLASAFGLPILGRFFPVLMSRIAETATSEFLETFSGNWDAGTQLSAWATPYGASVNGNFSAARLAQQVATHGVWLKTKARHMSMCMCMHA